MSGLIDRQQAIDVIDKEQKEIDVSDVSAMYAYSKCKTIIKQLPSALGTNLAEVGRDCISRQSAIDALRKLREEDIEDYGCEIPEGFNQDHLDRATFAIKQLPSAQPEIIRCKDCKHRDNYGCCKHWKGLAMGDIPIATDDNDFCSYGER